MGLPEGGLRVSTAGVTLVGHSFGASTVLSAAAAIGRAGDAVRASAAADAAADGALDERALVAVSGAGTQPGSERERESKSESSSATATATASDGTDGLLLAEATPEATVGAVVVLDPWISGYNCSTDGAAAAPTLALTTQSMMYPPNADAVGAVLGRVAAQGQTALFAELADSRHQEVCSQ